MSPILLIVIGLCFMAGGSFVVIQGRRARRAQAEAGGPPLPTFFLVAYYIHFAIALVGVAMVARGGYAIINAPPVVMLR